MDNTVPLLALLITIIGWFYTGYQQKKLLDMQRKSDIESEFRNELQEKVLKVHAHLDKFARLNDLWRRKAGFSFIVAQDENGKVIPASKDKIKINEKYFLSDEDEIEAVIQMEGVTFDSLISRTKLTILLETGEIHDILAEIDDTKGLNKQLVELNIVSIYEFKSLYKNPQNWNRDTPEVFFNMLHKATETRQELRNQLDKIVKEKVKKHLATR